MTPDQLLGLQSRAKTATLSPEITIEDPDAVPTVIASGTSESIPIEITAPVAMPYLAAPRSTYIGAVVGFLIFSAWTVFETIVIVLS